METNLINILLADDEESDRLLFREALNELKIKTKVDSVNDGEQLMAYLTDKEVKMPNLVFIDLNMPRKGGLECLIEIRNNEQLKDISIAIYSTSASEKDIEETFRNGANVYIQKPNSFTKLKEVLSKAVSSAYLYRNPPFNIENFLLKV